VHLNIEARLTQLVGDAGKRLHTGRSRNDQVATDVRLWLRGEIDEIAVLLVEMQNALLAVAEKHTETVMPGYTHLQVAQPISFAHHLLAYVEMFARDAERLADVRKRVNRLPLGAAALAGTSYPLDRERVAKTLGFDGVCQNSLDAVSDRDFAIEFSAFASIVMIHVSRMAEEIVLWMNQNFGYVDLSDRYCTGSSIMPQKRNPDVAELARGKSGRVVGHLMALITLMKGQPLTYNKDNQEDKEPLFDTVDTVKDTLRIMAEMVAMSSQRHATRNTAQRQRPLQSRRTSQRSSNPRHHLILDPRRLQRPHLLIGTPKQHRIAALQANHNRMFLRRIHNLLVDELLRRRQLSAPLAHRNLARMRRVLEHRRFDQRVVQHDIRQTQQSRAPNRDEIRGPWPCTDQIHLTHLPQPHSYGPSQTPGRERTPG
jgi:hypothetical protein